MKLKLTEEARKKISEYFKKSIYHQETIDNLSIEAGKLRSKGWEMIAVEFPDVDFKNQKFTFNFETGDLESVGPKD